MARAVLKARVAYFINKLVFCLFAEDIELLADRIFAAILEAARDVAGKTVTEGRVPHSGAGRG